jgi:hypothetical protein
VSGERIPDLSQPLCNASPCHHYTVQGKFGWFEWLAAALFIALVVGAVAMGWSHSSSAPSNRGPTPGCVANVTC